MHAIVDLIVYAFLTVLAVAAIATAVEAERRERRRAAEYRKRLAYRDARKRADIAWQNQLRRAHMLTTAAELESRELADVLADVLGTRLVAPAATRQSAALELVKGGA